MEISGVCIIISPLVRQPIVPYVSTDCDWKNQPPALIEYWKIHLKPFAQSLKHFERSFGMQNASFAQLCSECVFALTHWNCDVVLFMGVMCDNANIWIHENTQPNKWHKARRTIHSHKTISKPRTFFSLFMLYHSYIHFFHSAYVNLFPMNAINIDVKGVGK